MTIWTKADAACEQLDAAIGLLAERRFIAAHTLVSAALQLATDVARATGKRTNQIIFEDAIKANAPERVQEVRRALRRPQNFAKHAESDHDQTIEVEPELTVVRLFATLFDLGITFERQTLRQVIFRAWFTARHPELALPGNEKYVSGAQEMFGMMDRVLLTEALEKLREQIVDLDAADLRARFDRVMMDAKVDWSASTRTWAGSPEG